MEMRWRSASPAPRALDYVAYPRAKARGCGLHGEKGLPDRAGPINAEKAPKSRRPALEFGKCHARCSSIA
jgi:hypothetical protein